MRPLSELIDDSNPAMATVRAWLEESPRHVKVLPCQRADGERALSHLQVTTRSTLGAVAYETGGVIVDHGWLRILGAGHAKLPRVIDRWNRRPDGSTRLDQALLVADDVVGGFFAINAGAFSGDAGNVFYLPPDTLDWEDTGCGHSDWLHWALTGDLATFYENARWPGWEREVEQLTANEGLSIYPFLFAHGAPVAERSRKVVPLEELWRLHAVELPKQLLAQRAP